MASLSLDAMSIGDPTARRDGMVRGLAPTLALSMEEVDVPVELARRSSMSA